jgi:exopolyphosphatase/guanosine-5'-triphosphate,3'-diphosphate pyrophosphatase
MSRRIAVFSIGTNSTRALLADVEPETPRVELARSIGTRIGEGLGDSGRLGDEPMGRTLEVLRGYMGLIRGHYVKLIVIGTSALRRAGNGEAFAAKVSEIAGAPLRTLSGDEEAVASYRGALTVLGPLRGERVGVVDMGGGSTEYAAGTSLQPDDLVSCEIGAVRLTEAVPSLAGDKGTIGDADIARAQTLAAEALEPLKKYAKVERLAMVGGTATTVAAILKGRPSAVTSAHLRRDDLQKILDRLLALPLDERKKIPGMKPQRADILPAGIVVLLAAMDATRCDEAVATSSDLLLGVALQERDALTGRAERHEGYRTSRAH